MLREIAHERYGAMIQEFQRNFDKQLGEFMGQLLADAHLQYNRWAVAQECGSSTTGGQ
jgi:hypothetical protein